MNPKIDRSQKIKFGDILYFKVTHFHAAEESISESETRMYIFKVLCIKKPVETLRKVLPLNLKCIYKYLQNILFLTLIRLHFAIRIRWLIHRGN